MGSEFTINAEAAAQAPTVPGRSGEVCTERAGAGEDVFGQGGRRREGLTMERKGIDHVPNEAMEAQRREVNYALHEG